MFERRSINPCIIAAGCDFQQTQQILFPGLSFGVRDEIPYRFVTNPRHLKTLPRDPNIAHGHLILSQCATLVGADDGYLAKFFHSGQFLRQHTSLRETLDCRR
jgi:hypothetical protein